MSVVTGPGLDVAMSMLVSRGSPLRGILRRVPGEAVEGRSKLSYCSIACL
jgi:hypothetical protein